ncbi:MAG: hypothetical protein ACTSPI_11075 [Candidatus Heimdallarchaeaceae archaeon]
MDSPRFKLNKEDLMNILKVLGWTIASAVVVALMDVVKAVEVPASVLWLMPAINSGLVALKKLLQNKVERS